TVAAVGLNEYGQCNVCDWRDIVAIAAGCSHTIGLKSDGTVVAVGDNEYGQCDVSGWRGIQLP
ncbi:RCC1 domain-containing protein, partial [Neobacillus drentensis]